jgi:hypothetical protein
MPGSAVGVHLLTAKHNFCGSAQAATGSRDAVRVPGAVMLDLSQPSQRSQSDFERFA